MSFQNLVKELEKLQRQGQGNHVRERLSKLKPGKIPRAFAFKIANLARRSNLIHLALKILNPIVRSKNPSLKPATDEEKVEYAILLYKIGATLESHRILDEIDMKETPSALISKSYALFSQWRYEESLDYLERYVGSKGLSNYETLIGNLNLVAALKYSGDLGRAYKLAIGISNQAKLEDLVLVQANSLELLSQVAFEQGEFKKALRLLNEAKSLLNQHQDLNQFYIDKMKTLVSVKSGNANINDLDILKKKALKIGHWETVRESDFYKSIFLRDKNLFLKVYFGTPYPSYKERMIKMWGKPVSIPDYYFKSKEDSPEKYLDIESACDQSGNQKLKVGQKLHQALKVMCLDSYRPVLVGQLYSVLFENEYFNPSSSPTRVYQIVKRLRHWAKSECVKIEISNENGYQIRTKGKFGLKIPSEISIQEKDSKVLLLENLYGEFRYGTFSNKEAVQFSGLSKSTLNEYLKWAVKKGFVCKQGSRKAIKYLFLEKFKKAG